MKINRKNLLTALTKVKPGLAGKEMIEQSTSFCFIKGNVVTYNDEISISYPIENIGIEGAVNAVELLAFVNRVKSEEIDLQVDENEILLRAGRSKAGLTLKSEVLLPIEEIGDIQKWKKLPDDFLKSIKMAMGSCSRDMSQPILTCVHVNKNVIEASDRYRIIQYQLEKKVPIKAFLLPANSCSKVVSISPIEIAQGQGWVHFKTKEGAVLSCRVFEDKFPDIAPHMEVKGTSLTFPKSILGIIDRADIFSKREHSLDETMTIRLGNKKLEIKSESDAGWFSEKSRIDYSGDEIEFKVTPYLLKDVLEQVTEGILSKDKLLFEGRNWVYMTLLKA